MVAIASHSTTNGVANDSNPSEPTPPVASGADHDTVILNAELAAAADYLQVRISDPSLAETVTSAAESGDALAATNALADAFLTALDAPPDPDGPSSLDGCMQELVVWLKKKCAMDTNLVNKIADGLCRSTSSPSLRLRCMALLYNSVNEQSHEKRFDLLTKTVSLASSLDMVPNIVDTVLPKIDIFLKQWHVDLPEKRKMYRVTYDALKKANMPDRAFAVNVKLLALYNGASADEQSTVRDATIDVIVQAVRLPKLYRFDTLLELDVVQRFESLEDDCKRLYQLICIFVRDDLAIFREFRENNENLLSKYEIDAEVAENKMRLLTFASLGIESPDLTYKMIAVALQIGEDEVEEWVIRAISSGLVDAKINQLKSTVAIYRSTQRQFTLEEWQPLSERINIWKENVGELLASLRETRDASAKAAIEAFSG